MYDLYMYKDVACPRHYKVSYWSTNNCWLQKLSSRGHDGWARTTSNGPVPGRVTFTMWGRMRGTLPEWSFDWDAKSTKDSATNLMHFQRELVATLEQLPNLRENVRTRSTYTPNGTSANQPKAIVNFLMSWKMIECDLSFIFICLTNLPPLLAEATPYPNFDRIRSTFSLRYFSVWKSAIGRSDSSKKMITSRLWIQTPRLYLWRIYRTSGNPRARRGYAVRLQVGF